jgi:hypothetical protein
MLNVLQSPLSLAQRLSASRHRPDLQPPKLMLNWRS